jgi:hypothetical protein
VGNTTKRSGAGELTMRRNREEQEEEKGTSSRSVIRRINKKLVDESASIVEKCLVRA